MNKEQTTIFNQLILNVIVPTLIALLIMATINFRNTRNLIYEANNEKNRIVSNEISEVLGFQELAVSIIEKNMSERMENLSEIIVHDYFSGSVDPSKVDLEQIRSRMGMNPLTEDIYVIDREGTIINTTYQKDLNFNLFKIGAEHKRHLMRVFDTCVFVNTRFAMEASTNKPRKYTYHATEDREYIVELGAYSSEADEVLANIESIKKRILEDSIGIIGLEIFYKADTIFSLNKNAVVYEDKKGVLTERFEKCDTLVITEKVDKKWLHFQYIYVPRENSMLYDGLVIRIVSDRTSERLVARKEFFKLLVLLFLTLIAVMSLIYRKVKVITKPIKKLVDNVDRITGGQLSERAEVVGNNEITRLSEKFNSMIDELEKYYNELDQMVKDRTAEIEKQKIEIQGQADILKVQKDELSDRNTKLNEAYTEIDEQRKHIMDSIHYARRIQTAILPSTDFFHQVLPQSFILYKPKDIVSGDFYWLHVAEDAIMVAAVDCTGHGVPGAFMSIVGHNQLNQAVNISKARRADEILNHLNSGVIKTLTEHSSGSKVTDGMDMAIGVFDRKMKQVEFAGANNPMVIVRDGELTLYKGDKFPIGSYEGNVPRYFSRTNIELKKDDMVYLFSDGYADQFGGMKDKKFTSKRLRELILEIHMEPVSKQRELLEMAHIEWRGGKEQIDDILIIGIRI